MASLFKLEIVTPERVFFSGDCESLVLNTTNGEMGILAGHMPMVAAVAVGTVRIKTQEEWKEAFLSEGFLEIKGDKTVILTDTAEWPDEIDINRAKRAKERAEEKLQQNLSKIEYARSRAALARALARLRIANEKNK